MKQVQQETEQRRTFLRSAIASTGVILCGGTLAAILQACESDTIKSTAERPFTFSLTEHPELASVGGAIYKAAGSFNNGAEIIIIRQSETEFLAVTSVCTHQGCTVLLPEEPSSTFMECPCHGARFSTTDGSWVQSPQTTPRLPRFRTEFNSGSNELTIYF
jgi:nitrite reductase/ring-hydroxylating ferredoxin subunit